MSKEKTKSLKPKTTGMDILYRVVTALLAIAVPVAAFFCELIYYVVESEVFALIAQLKGDTTDDGSTYGGYSIYKFVKEVVPLFGDNQGSGNVIWNALNQVHAALISSGVFFAVAMIIAVVSLFFALFSNKKLPQLILTCLGIISVVGMFISFSKFAAPLVSGQISLGSFFGSGIVSAILPYVASFSVLRLSDAFFVVLFLYIGSFLWTGSNMLINMGDTPKTPKKAK